MFHGCFIDHPVVVGLGLVGVRASTKTSMSYLNISLQLILRKDSFFLKLCLVYNTPKLVYFILDYQKCEGGLRKTKCFFLESIEDFTILS